MKQLGIILLIILISFISEGQSDYKFRKLDFCLESNNEFGGNLIDDWFIFSADYRKGEMNSDGNTILFKTKLDDNNNWVKPVIFNESMGKEEGYGPVSLFDPTTLYFTVYKFHPKKLFSGIDSKNVAFIHIKKKNNKNGKWSKLTKGFIYNGIQSFTGHPTFDQENEKMFFSADFQYSKGGADIYYCFRDGGDWSEPITIGKRINTSGDELFPYYYEGRLYFSSNMHGSSGGFDIFYSKYENGEWSDPVALEEPVNSTSDDFAFNIMNQRNMLFSSDRDGNFDIYSYQPDFPEFNNCSEKFEANYCIYVKEEGTADLDTSIMIYEWEMGDGTRIKGNGLEYCYKNEGDYKIILNVIDKLTGVRTDCVASIEVNISTPRGLFYSLADTIDVNKEFVIREVKNQLGDYDNRILFWNMGDETEIAGDEIRHSYTKLGTYDVVLGVLKNELDYMGSERYCIHKKVIVK